MHDPTGPRRIFTYEQALATFPQVRDLTVAAVRQIEAMFSRLQSRQEREERAAELEAAHDEIVRAWVRRIHELGCEAKGLWTVDWDSGDGCFCWAYPEESLSHFHGYDDGFAGRVPIN
jgi:hypothetical protein